jgi:hypothetical protein
VRYLAWAVSEDMNTASAGAVAFVLVACSAVHAGDSAVKTERHISFRQLCFSYTRDGDKARDAAINAFRKVAGQPVDSDGGVANLADHATLPSYYGDLTAEQVAKVFGETFARSLFQLKAGSWQGPIKSVSGWHLVWIDSVSESEEDKPTHSADTLRTVPRNGIAEENPQL